jgi:hypothetical protein
VRVEDIIDFAWDMLMLKATIAHLLSHFSIGIHRDEPRDDWEVVENFSRLFLAITALLVSLLMTVRALFTIAVRPNKTAARVYTAMVSLRLET